MSCSQLGCSPKSWDPPQIQLHNIRVIYSIASRRRHALIWHSIQVVSACLTAECHASIIGSTVWNARICSYKPSGTSNVSQRACVCPYKPSGSFATSQDACICPYKPSVTSSALQSACICPSKPSVTSTAWQSACRCPYKPSGTTKGACAIG